MVTFKFILLLSVTFVSESANTEEVHTDYDPDTQNTYHLFTRDNPYVSQPLLLGNEFLLQSSNFNPGRRTIYLIHGFIADVSALFNKILVPAFLEAANVNVIAVDWGIGAWSYGEALHVNTVKSGQSGARFLNWVSSMTGASAADYHIIGYSMGAHQAAVTARNVNGTVGYVTALDPANTLHDSEHFFGPDCGAYTEAIHTYSEVAGYGRPLAHADFYPNGGNYMLRCEDDDGLCQHESTVITSQDLTQEQTHQTRSRGRGGRTRIRVRGRGYNSNRRRKTEPQFYSCFFYMAESLSTEYIGTECATYEDARAGNCDLPNTLRMGGLWPKTGSTGLYYLVINSASTLSTSFFLIFIAVFTCFRQII